METVKVNSEPESFRQSEFYGETPPQPVGLSCWAIWMWFHKLQFTVFLIGGFKHFLCSLIYGIILPIDELICFKMVKTTNQVCLAFGDLPSNQTWQWQTILHR